MNNRTVNNANQWIVYIKNEMHTVDLREENKLYVDNEHIGDIKESCIINYEYKFKIGDTDCSLVKLVVDKEFQLVVDGKYLNIKRSYLPLSTPLFSTYIFLVLDFIALCVFTIMTYSGDLDLPQKLFYIAITMCLCVVMAKCVRALANCSCRIENDKLNKLFRFTLMLLIEGFYIGGIITMLTFTA